MCGEEVTALELSPMKLRLAWCSYTCLTFLLVELEGDYRCELANAMFREMAALIELLMS